MLKNIPLFPLNTVLFPEGILPLRIFEVRYLDMVSESLRNESPFGICLISEGKEVGSPADCYRIGTFAHIIDWEGSNDSILGITVQGGKRFRISDQRVRDNKLLEGDVEIIEDIWANRDREYNIRCLVRRLQRIDKEMSAEARMVMVRMHRRF